MKAAWDNFLKDTISGYEHSIVSYGEHEKQFIGVSLPHDSDGSNPIIVWYHGGGLTGGEREVPRMLFNGKNVILEVRYRLSGDEFNGLDCLEDATTALAYAIKHVADFKASSKKIFVGGMSAGAYLAAMVGCAPHLLGKHGEDHRKLAGLLIVAGQMTTHFRLKDDLHYEHKLYHPVIDEYAPFYYASPDIAPIIMITGEDGYDIPGRPAENAFFAETLRVMGHKFVEQYALAGHDHSGAFDSSDYLLLKFIEKVLHQ